MYCGGSWRTAPAVPVEQHVVFRLVARLRRPRGAPTHLDGRLAERLQCLEAHRGDALHERREHGPQAVRGPRQKAVRARQVVHPPLLDDPLAFGVEPRFVHDDELVLARLHHLMVVPAQWRSAPRRFVRKARYDIGFSRAWPRTRYTVSGDIMALARFSSSRRRRSTCTARRRSGPTPETVLLAHVTVGRRCRTRGAAPPYLAHVLRHGPDGDELGRLAGVEELGRGKKRRLERFTVHRSIGIGLHCDWRPKRPPQRRYRG